MPIWGSRLRARASSDPDFSQSDIEGFAQVRILALIAYISGLQDRRQFYLPAVPHGWVIDRLLCKLYTRNDLGGISRVAVKILVSPAHPHQPGWFPFATTV